MSLSIYPSKSRGSLSTDVMSALVDPSDKLLPVSLSNISYASSSLSKSERKSVV